MYYTSHKAPLSMCCFFIITACNIKYTQKSWQVYSLAITYYKINQWKSAKIKHFVMTYLIRIWYKRAVVKNIQNTISILIIVAAVSKLVIFAIKLKKKVLVSSCGKLFHDISLTSYIKTLRSLRIAQQHVERLMHWSHIFSHHKLPTKIYTDNLQESAYLLDCAVYVDWQKSARSA